MYFLDNPPIGQLDNTGPTLASSMRQQALLRHGDKMQYEWILLDLGPKYNLIGQSVQCQPAQWAVKRNMDFVPFNYGFNNSSENTWTDQVATKDGSLNYYNIYLGGGGAAAIKIRLVAAGSTNVGWTNGVIGYGDVPPDGLKIVVTKSPNYPSASVYDFEKDDNSVTILLNSRLSDGGMAYLAAAIADGGINFAVLNTNPDADAEYDLFIEIDFEPNLQRRYFPSPGTKECFSHCIDGTPPGNLDSFAVNKPIPQNGYCIFKVRATRMPVANSAGKMITPSSGDEINIVLGQNKLQPDGTLKFAPFLTGQQDIGAGDAGTGAGDGGAGAGGAAGLSTITIPADARDSGDVEVFIPVLGGNELVWQCDEMVIVEAWANWQPVFFAPIYGYYENEDTSLASFDATAFQYCSAFSNWFVTWLSNNTGYGGYGGLPATRTQFPMGVEIFNDLEACLNLI
jgi:hypothetical protein